MTEPTVRCDVDGDVGRITLDRPPLNILTVPMMEGIAGALDRVAREPRLRALVLAAEGRAFSAGVAVEEHLGERAKPMLAAFHRIFRDLYALECPTVAAVHGPALGGGAELAVFCDVVIAAETATIGQPEITVGVFPPIAALRYPARIGSARTLQLLLSGQVLSAREAERIGLVDRVVAMDGLADAVAETVATFTAKSATALRLAKRAVRMAAGDDFDARLSALEELYLWELMPTEDAEEGLRAFLAKRPPVWRHR